LRSNSLLHGCRSVDCYEKLNRIEEGAYGVVYRARDKETGEVVALKKIKMDKEREGFPLTSLREVKILTNLSHENIVDVREIVVGSNLNSIYIVMEFLEHDLKGLMEEMKHPFSQSEIKCLMLQLLSAIAYMHDKWVLHRDLKKTSNLLMNNKGILKVADFGLAREYGSPLKSYTHIVVTLWYRAPELLLGSKTYSTAIDMWSIGCIFAELLSKEPLLQGRSELDQIDKMFKLLGTANEKIWPGYSQLSNVKKVTFAYQPYNNLRTKFHYLTEAGFDLLNRLLTYDPSKRISAAEALEHPYFGESPLPKAADMMPTFPSSHEGSGKKKKTIDEDQRLKIEMMEERNAADNSEA